MRSWSPPPSNKPPSLLLAAVYALRKKSLRQFQYLVYAVWGLMVEDEVPGHRPGIPCLAGMTSVSVSIPIVVVPLGRPEISAWSACGKRVAGKQPRTDAIELELEKIRFRI